MSLSENAVAGPSGTTGSPQSDTKALQAYKYYPFDTDQTYQEGLQTLLANGSLTGEPEARQVEVLRQTRVFFFNRQFGSSITMEEAYRCENDLLAESKPAPTRTPEEPHTLSYQEVQDLISAGRMDEIPFNKKIPDALNEAPPSQSVAPCRRKPWEGASTQW